MYVKANRMKPYAASLATTNSCKTQLKAFGKYVSRAPIFNFVTLLKSQCCGMIPFLKPHRNHLQYFIKK